MRYVHARAAIAACVVLLAMVALAACGSDDSNDAKTTSGTGDGGVTAEAQTIIDRLWEGTNLAPPTESAKPRPGTNVWYVPFDRATREGAVEAVSEAAQRIGWDLTVCDGKLQSDKALQCVNQAVADRAEGIMLDTLDCPVIKAGLQRARAAGIRTTNLEAIDCDQAAAGQPSLIDANVHYAPVTSDPDDGQLPYLDWIREYGEGMAYGVIAATDGQAKVIDIFETDLHATREIEKGIKQVLAEECPGCEVVDTVRMVATDYGARLQQFVAQSLTRHPDATAIVGPGADIATVGSVAPAVRQAGRTDDVFVMGAEGRPEAVEEIRNGNGVNAGLGFSVRWEGLCNLHNMIQLLAGEREPEGGWPCGVGVQLFDADRNLPPKGQPYQAGNDFESDFYRAWGVDDAQ